MQGSDIAWLFRWEPATHAAYGSALHHWRGRTCWWSPPWGFASRFQKACGLFNICFRQVHIMDPPLVDDIIILRVQSLANWCVSNSYQMLPALERILKLKPLANPASCPSTIILHLPSIQLSCFQNYVLDSLHIPLNSGKILRIEPLNEPYWTIRWCQPKWTTKWSKGHLPIRPAGPTVGRPSLDLKHFVAWVSHRTRIRHLQGHTNTY